MRTAVVTGANRGIVLAIAEGLNDSVHSKGAHGYGSLVRAVGGVTLHHNLWAHNDSRNPRLGDNYGVAPFPTFDVRNNVIYDWGGGLIWAAVPPKPDARAAIIRQRVEAAGGHATLIRGPDEVRRQVDVFQPQPAGLAALAERVRQSFDPNNILNRGRMARGSSA